MLELEIAYLTAAGIAIEKEKKTIRARKIIGPFL
jgi:hypothetical protein